MKKMPITHLIISTSSSDEYDDGDCDFCLVPMTVEYVGHLLDRMDEVHRMHKADTGVYSLECWDGCPAYFRDNDRFQELRDIDGDLAADVPRGEPILLTANPDFSAEDFQRVECQTVQISNDDVWWTAYVKHTNIRIESAHIRKKTLLRIYRSLGGVRESCGQAKVEPVHPAIRRIHDLLYLDMQNGKEFYNRHKQVDSQTMTEIAETVARHISKPKPVGP